MPSDRQSSAGYGKSGPSASGKRGGPGPSAMGKKGGPGPSAMGKMGKSKMNGPGPSAKGSPLTRHIGSSADYEKNRMTPKAFDYVPSIANKAVTGSFFASEGKFNQMRDIKEAYRGYKNSPPHAGMTGHKGFGSALEGNARGSKR